MPRVSARTDSAQQTNLDTIVDRAQQEKRSIMTGAIEILGLEEVRQAFGSAWEAVSDNAREIAETEIKRHLGEGDYFDAQSDTRFMICFASLDRHHAEDRARQIAQAVNARLLEELREVGEDATVDNFVTEVDPSNLSPNGQTLADRMAATLSRMQREVENAAAKQRKMIVRDFQLHFSPLWHTEDQVTYFNRCMLDESQYAQAVLRAERILSEAQVSRMLSEFDCMVLTRSLEHVHAAWRGNRASFLMVPVNLRTLLQRETRREYMHLLSLVPAAYKDALMLELCGLDAQNTIKEVLSLCEIVGEYVAKITLQVDLDSPLLPMLERGDIEGLSCSLGEEDAADEALQERLTRFVALAREAGATTYANRANTLGLASLARRCGFDYIGGPAIHLTTSEPRPPLRLKPMFDSEDRGAVPRIA